MSNLSITLPTTDLIAKLESVKYAKAKAKSDPRGLNWYQLDINDDGINIYTTNSHRMAAAHLPCQSNGQAGLGGMLYDKEADAIIQFLKKCDGNAAIRVNDDTLTISAAVKAERKHTPDRNGRISFAVNIKKDGGHLDMSKVAWHKERAGESVGAWRVAGGALIALCEAAFTIKDTGKYGENPHIELAKVSDGGNVEIHAVGKGSATGRVNVSGVIRGTSDDTLALLPMAWDYRYLKDAITACGKGDIVLHFGADKTQGIAIRHDNWSDSEAYDPRLKSSDGSLKDYHLIMPLRL